MKSKNHIPKKKFLNLILSLIIGLFVLIFLYAVLTGKPLEKVSGKTTPGWYENMTDQRWRIGK
ncbi:MAG: hypothetical protein JNL11_19195 [Bdellovibrionaceae bacterium]|nr:hypothetical protein [Pseudobdellovibrionaceae bacterium]